MADLERGPHTAVFTFRSVPSGQVDRLYNEVRADHLPGRGTSKDTIPSEGGSGDLKDLIVFADCSPDQGNAGCVVHQCRRVAENRPQSVKGFRASHCRQCSENKSR